MTIEIQRQGSTLQYRQREDDPCVIERRENKAGSRWYWYLRRDTPSEARAALLQLGSEEEGNERRHAV